MRIELVNGYVCRNCTDVELAKKGVDPAHPKDGPNGVYKADNVVPVQPVAPTPAVRLDGALAEAASPSTRVQPAAYVPGAIADLRV
jgi:hypothetical protein